jgi:hypothetical protein
VFGLIAPLLLLPAIFLGVVVWLFVKGSWAIALQGLGFAAVGFAATVWAINQSRSSTAGIGYLGVPFAASVVGFLGVIQGAAMSGDRTRWRRVISFAAFALMLVFVSFVIRQGLETRERNAIHNVEQAQFSAAVARDRAGIDSVLKLRPGEERVYLDSAIRARMSDRAFLIAALAHDSISAGVLDTLANSPDLGITLEAVRNPGTASSTLERIYRTHTYPNYFFQALASHPHTPPTILRELYKQRPQHISGLDIWLAGNPSAPKDVLKGLADSATETHVIAQLLENPSADCNVLGKLAKTLMQRQKKDADDLNVARLAEKVPEVCASAADSDAVRR